MESLESSSYGLIVGIDDIDLGLFGEDLEAELGVAPFE